jgi:large subunit ribosomal protein L20
MSRVKRGVIKQKRRKNTLAKVKGYRHGRGTKEAQARDAIRHAGAYAFAHRRDKKGDMRELFQVKINAVTKSTGLSYSKFMGSLKKKGIALDRKILADLAENKPETFDRVLKTL